MLPPAMAGSWYSCSSLGEHSSLILGVQVYTVCKLIAGAREAGESVWLIKMGAVERQCWGGLSCRNGAVQREELGYVSRIHS